ncbi:MAG: hypothetical protein GQE15_17095 [Archangiaceae bacterium]|nr:hypothetical protein [Archangiaceae bacterium]
MTRAGLLLVVCSLGCEGTIVVGGPVDVTSPAESSDPTTSGVAPVIPSLPSVATCMNASSGRGYLGLAGEPLEAGRGDVAALVDNHRPFRSTKDPNSPNWSVMTEIARSLGTNTTGDSELTNPGVGAAFGVVPAGWYEESEVGAFAVYVTLQYAAKVCERASATTTPSLKSGWFEHTAAPPTRASAEAFCSRTMRAAWLRAPTRSELAACADLALTLEEPDVKKRWALVCASVFASPNFLAN